MNIVIGSSIGGAAVTYEIIAVFGYLTFGTKVRELFGYLYTVTDIMAQVGANIIAMYPSTSLFIAIGQLAIAILVMFSYPLQVHPCRNCLDKVFHAATTQYKPVPDGEEDEEDVDDENHVPADMTPMKHTLLTVAIVASGFAIAYFVDDLQMGKWLRVSRILNIRDKAPFLTYCGYFFASSAILCRVNRVYNDLVYTSRPVLLEGEWGWLIVYR